MQLDFAYPAATGSPVAGVDEVGRGPLAGDVVAAAVILNPNVSIPFLNDSKKLSEKQREKAFEAIVDSCVCYALGRASPQEIDEINILQASLLAMLRAVEGLRDKPGFVYVDGLYCPKWQYPCAAVVKGDSKVDSIAAASILAKVTRDREMLTLDEEFPGYGFASHKAYPTKVHMEALERLGPCAAHRRSYKPVMRFINGDDSN